MDGQGTAGSLVCAIPSVAVFSWLVTRLMSLGRELLAAANESLKPGMSPADTHQFEARVEELVREMARLYIEFCFNLLEPSQVDAMPQNISYRNQPYRRLKQKSTRASILTRFGNITLNRAIYRQGSRGRTISPLEEFLGIECGATPGARDLIGRQVAAAGASLSVIADGKRIGTVYLARAPEENQETLDPSRGSTHPDPPLHPAQPNLDNHIP